MWHHIGYGVATVSRIDEIIGLCCRISPLLQVIFAKETYNLIDPTDCSHPISKTHNSERRHSKKDVCAYLKHCFVRTAEVTPKKYRFLEYICIYISIYVYIHACFYIHVFVFISHICSHWVSLVSRID